MNNARLIYRLEQTGARLPERIRKRDGSIVTFDVGRIARAIEKCYTELNTQPEVGVESLVMRASYALSAKAEEGVPTVEGVQDLVEITLLSAGEIEAARAYIAYRDARAEERGGREVPEDVRQAFEDDKKYFATPSQQFVFYDKYSRFNWDLNRRETWHETVDRCIDHLKWEVAHHVISNSGVGRLSDKELAALPLDKLLAMLPWHGEMPISDHDFARLHAAILEMRVMPSMRLLAMAGEAAQRNSMALYNCSYLPVKDTQAFVEAMLISMAGCGVGFSVERDYIEQFPRIERQTGEILPPHLIVDTTEGWADALRVGLQTWWSGRDITFDASSVRPAGAVLRTKGGRASGPDPLMATLAALRSIVLARQGRTLESTDAQLMMCWVGEAAVQGGVRRTAMISLFDHDDQAMRTIKNGPAPQFGTTPDGRNVLWNANNSAVWPDDISEIEIIEQMLEMAKAKTGEPGIFSRANAVRTKPERRQEARFGTNPCGEIMLREFGFCNLSQAVGRAGDTEQDLRDKVELATLVGIIQSLSTRFPGLRPEWKQNCEEERLLGVDLTAQADCELLRENTPEGAALREMLLAHSVYSARYYSERLGVNMPAAISCNKPAGNSAELLDSSNGLHRRKAAHYKRRITVGAHGPLFRVLKEAGVPMEPRYGSTAETATAWIATFLKASPEGAPLISDASVIDQCEFWLLNKEHWTEHNPSCTITYREHELVDLIKWVVDHKDRIGGLSFFPATDAVYAQAPYEEISNEEYNRLTGEFPNVDFSLVYAYEKEDMTTAAQELACFAGSCEI